MTLKTREIAAENLVLPAIVTIFHNITDFTVFLLYKCSFGRHERLSEIWDFSKNLLTPNFWKLVQTFFFSRSDLQFYFLRDDLLFLLSSPCFTLTSKLSKFSFTICLTACSKNSHRCSSTHLPLFSSHLLSVLMRIILQGSSFMLNVAYIWNIKPFTQCKPC